MRTRATTAILATAVSGLVGLTTIAPAQSARDAAPAAAATPGNAPADQQANLPVRQVVLYSSGVGYFEHFGAVQGNGSTKLMFKTQQINDILKSLVLQDMDNGKVGVITYPSQDPIAKLLRSFQVDIANNPSLAELMNQLRGAQVTVTSGAEKINGTILGVERKKRPIGSGGDAKVIEIAVLNLLTDGGIRSIELDEVRTFELQDARLREELNRALAALASARDQDKKPVTISFQGQGERRLRIGYVVETPVWKTSYRLVLSDKPAAGRDGGDAQVKPNLGGKPEGGPGAGAPGGGAAGDGGKPAGSGNLQGWAIVENQTDNDWTNVQLSLVSGRPISFVMDLYQPLYIPRPVVLPELYASLRPQTYEGGIAERRQVDEFLRENAGAAATPAPAPVPAPAAQKAESQANAAGLSADKKQALGDLDASASVTSIASAAKVGELFQYTVGNVTLPRQTSAMIPVVTDPMEVEKLSIYNLSVLPRNPLLGARVKNTTGKHLLQGPVTVLDGGSYAGDARIEDLPPGQERLISYGVDQQILVQAQNSKQENRIQTGKIVAGVLTLTRKLVASQDYTADNKGDKARTLIIEHARRGGWKLAEPAKADETTDALYRFKGSIDANKASKLTVREELITNQQVVILGIDDPTLLMYVQTGEIPQSVRDALATAARFRQAIAETKRQIKDRESQMNLITQEQNRIRENMKTVSQNTDYYNRLLVKLSDQESSIDTLQKENDALRQKQESQQKEMEGYLKGLNVE